MRTLDFTQVKALKISVLVYCCIFNGKLYWKLSIIEYIFSWYCAFNSHAASSIINFLLSRHMLFLSSFGWISLSMCCIFFSRYLQFLGALSTQTSHLLCPTTRTIRQPTFGWVKRVEQLTLTSVLMLVMPQRWLNLTVGWSSPLHSGVIISNHLIFKTF